ncbi:MAG: hypothetical protein JW750_09090 [Anaerolineaceae bacterium]|nr:hypothetical protein [Anaerolineaceae bacterium]
MLRRKDLIWLYGLPVYLWLNSMRRGLALSLAVWIKGGAVEKFRLIPAVQFQGWFQFEQIAWRGEPSLLIVAAPYLFDLLTFIIFYGMFTRFVFRRRWVFINLFIFGMISPIIHSMYHYLLGGVWENDVSRIMNVYMQEPLAHVLFVLMIGFFALAIQQVTQSSPTAKYYRELEVQELKRKKKEKKERKRKEKEHQKNREIKHSA